MIPQSVIDNIFASDLEFNKHFILKNLCLKKGDFLYLDLKSDSDEKDLETIVNTLDHFYEEIQKLGDINLVYSFKKLKSFGDLGHALTVRLFIAINDQGGKFIVLEPRKYVMDVIELTDLDKAWLIYDSEQDFLNEMNS